METAEPRLRRFTRDEYYWMAELGFFQDQRVELVEGDILALGPQLTPHSTGVRLVSKALEQAYGTLFDVRSQLPMTLGAASEPEPDVVVVRGTPRDYLASHPSTAVVVVEVSDSSLRYDRKTKGSLYARARLPEYWILDLQGRRLEVYRRPIEDSAMPFGYGYAERSLFGPADIVVPPLLDAPLPVADIIP